MKKILVLYAAYGGGHQSAANSIKTYLENNAKDVIVDCIDCMKYINKGIEKITTDSYKEITKNAPHLWKYVYDNSQKGALSKISNTSNKLMAKKLLQLFDEFNPDIVVSTHPFATQMTSYLKKKEKINCKLATILTDFAPHEQWLVGKEFDDYFFVSNEQMKISLVENDHIDENKIFITGIPLSDKFLHEFNTAEIYKTFDLTPSKKVITFFGGGEFGLGKEKNIALLKALSKHLDNYQIVAISGKNKKMFKDFQNVADELNNSSLKIYEYINNVPELLHISDLVVTKPGGLTITESLASELPIIIINPIPGQEEENAAYLENAGAGIWLKDLNTAAEKITELLSNDEKISEMKVNSKRISHKNSTQDICNIILNS